MSSHPINVLIVRGHQVSPWGLRPWERLPERFRVSCLLTGSNMFDAGSLALEKVKIRTLRDFLPRGRAGDLAAVAIGDRFFGLDRHLGEADVVHAEEIHTWLSAQVAERKRRYGWKLVLTVWETLPMLAAYRNKGAREHRRRVLDAVDLFLPATERAGRTLRLEGVPEERIIVCPPGIDLERFASRNGERAGSTEHVIVSPGRLVWEKGHQDVLRAVAAIERGLVENPSGSTPRVLVVGAGPEHDRLKAHAAELGIEGLVELRPAVPYDEMPSVFGQASCMVLASLPSAGCALVSGPPHCFWEEQFGFVLAEAMAAGLPIVASNSGAIPEVVGPGTELFAPGDWMELARKLGAGPLSRPPGERAAHDPEKLRELSIEAAAERLASAYERVAAKR